MWLNESFFCFDSFLFCYDFTCHSKRLLRSSIFQITGNCYLCALIFGLSMPNFWRWKMMLIQLIASFYHSLTMIQPLNFVQLFLSMCRTSGKIPFESRIELFRFKCAHPWAVELSGAHRWFFIVSSWHLSVELIECVFIIGTVSEMIFITEMPLNNPVPIDAAFECFVLLRFMTVATMMISSF